MEERVRRIFLSEAGWQCNFALIAVGDLKQALQTQDEERIWYSLHAFLVAAGNISKLLWPGRNKTPRKPKVQGRPQIPKRGEELRAHLSIPKDSPMVARRVRNHFEHLDERLEAWAAQPQTGLYGTPWVGPPRDLFKDDTVKHFFRNFDKRTFTLTFCGEVYELRPIIKAVRGLHRKLVKKGLVRVRLWGP